MNEGEKFSPYKSPVCSSNPKKQPQQNTTGSLRRLKDTAVDVHNLVEKWEALNSKGNQVLSELVNKKLNYMYKKDQEEDGRSEKTDFASLASSLEPNCETLHRICQSMEDLVGKLTALASAAHGLHALSQTKGDANTIKTTQQCVSALDSLHSMYTKEIGLKKEICRSVAHAETRETLMFHSAAWMHQPYTDSAMIVNMLLMETGQLEPS